MRIRALWRRLRAKLSPARVAPYRGSRGTGQRWERLAARRLSAEGFRILARNYRGRSGEIDLIAEEAGVLCFVEVKGKSGSGYGAPEEAVTREKQRRIARVAQEYLRARRLSPSATLCRFDVVAIRQRDGDEPQIEIHRDAFPLPEGFGRGRVLH